MKSNFLILKGSKRTIFLIDKIRKYYPEAKIILIDKNKSCYARQYSDFFLNCDAEDFKLIKEKISKRDIFICLTRSSGQTGLIASKINKYLGFNNPNIKIISNFFSCYKLASLCKKNNLEYIKTSYVKKKFNLCSPVVIKSDIEKIGKKNVFYVNNTEKFIKFYDYVKDLSYNKKVIVQDYIAGSDITLLGYANNNGRFLIKRAYKEINSFKKNGGIEHKGFVPFNFLKSNNNYNAIRKVLNKIVSKSNLRLVPINFNFRISKNKKSYLNEINLYFGGENLIEKDFDFISDFLRFLKLTKN